MKENLQKSISYSLPSKDTLWKVLLDTKTNYLLLEKRNLQTMQVSFDILDLVSGEFVLQNKQIWENWWVSAVWLHQKKIVFSLYQEDTPIGKGVIVYDIAAKSVLWQNLAMNFFGANSHADCIFLRKNLESSQKQAYHLETGKLLDDIFGQDDENLLGHLANIYPPENPFYQDLQRFIYQKTQNNTRHPIHYKETKSHICIGYTIEIEEKFAYFLLITDIAGNMLFEEQVSSEKSASFLVHQHYLVVFQIKEVQVYFLSHKTEPYEN